MKKQPDKGKITALYERLSHDDERAGESVSIENQKGGGRIPTKGPMERSW